jgi:hypothetical protein
MGRRPTIDTVIADHLIDVLERLTGRAVRASRHPLDGKPHGLLFEILLHALRLAQWRAAFRKNLALKENIALRLRAPEELVKKLPTVEALAIYLKRRPGGLARLGLMSEN